MNSLLRKRHKSKHATIEPVGVVFPKLRGAEIGAAVAGARTGRDLCDSFRVNSMRVLFGLLELSGHRHQQSKVFPIVQQALRTAAEELLYAAEVNETEALSELCLWLNRSIIDAAGTAHSSPAFVGCYNEDLGTVCYFNAGHTPGLVRHISGVSELGATGLPLGLFSHTTNDANIIALEPGASLILVSKGVVETTAKGERFGLRGVETAWQGSAVGSAHDRCLSVLRAGQHYSDTRKPHQGLTALALIRAIS
jgi:serine phosphatase RsbU (regulator of sigma subunit)